MVSDVVSARTTRSLWFAVFAGPVAWSLDELVSLAITATWCSAPGSSGGAAMRLALVIVGLIALAAVAFGAARAARWFRDTSDAPRRTSSVQGNRVDRMHFLAMCGLLLSAISAFGITLRLITTLVTTSCG